MSTQMACLCQLTHPHLFRRGRDQSHGQAGRPTRCTGERQCWLGPSSALATCGLVVGDRPFPPGPPGDRSPRRAGRVPQSSKGTAAHARHGAFIEGAHRDHEWATHGDACSEVTGRAAATWSQAHTLESQPATQPHSHWALRTALARRPPRSFWVGLALSQLHTITRQLNEQN